MLDINPGLIIWTTLTFLILLFVLSKVAWKPLVNALHAREQGIRDALLKADEARRESERLLAENKAAMAKANEETSRILKEGRELAEQMKNDIVAKAREGARAMMDQAKEDIQREKETALLQLRSEVADLAVTAAEKIIDESLDEAKRKKLVDKTLQSLPNN
ncbi:MAG TPA: F0F1 ATP synthase subunit B [Bacteroidota bacterium]|nr:F0F1 ATP synthase subunit B [Bacteroidota bacterium]